MISQVVYQKVEYRKVEIRKSRINKVSDATYISDVVFIMCTVHPLSCVSWADEITAIVLIELFVNHSLEDEMTSK